MKTPLAGGVGGAIGNLSITEVCSVKNTAREKRIFKLAQSISNQMRQHPDRNEAIDAYDMARVLFRFETKDEGFNGRSSLALPMI